MYPVVATCAFHTHYPGINGLGCPLSRGQKFREGDDRPSITQ